MAGPTLFQSYKAKPRCGASPRQRWLGTPTLVSKFPRRRAADGGLRVACPSLNLPPEQYEPSGRMHSLISIFSQVGSLHRSQGYPSLDM